MTRQSRYEECQQLRQPFELDPAAFALLLEEHGQPVVLNEQITPEEARAELRRREAERDPSDGPWSRYAGAADGQADQRLPDGFFIDPADMETFLGRRALAARREGNEDAARVWVLEVARFRRRADALTGCSRAYPSYPVRTALGFAGFGMGVPVFFFLLGWALIWVGRGFRN
tara:strand:- start:846 stop:1364 length:519 start_codon:yes stop_codon:yes gene_type:complete